MEVRFWDDPPPEHTQEWEEAEQRRAMAKRAVLPSCPGCGQEAVCVCPEPEDDEGAYDIRRDPFYN